MFYLLIVSFIWAFSFSLIKAKLGNIDPFLVAFIRLTLATLVFLPFLRLRGLGSNIIKRLLCIGGIQFGGLYCAYTYSFHYLDAHLVALFTLLTPIYVTIINDILTRKFHLFYFAMALLAVTGASTAIIKRQATNLDGIFIGFALMQISNLCFAYGQIEYRRLRSEKPHLVDHQIYGLLYTGAVIVAALVTTLHTGWGTISTITLSQGCIFLYLGILASGICFFLWNKGATLTSVGTLAVFNNVKMPLAITISLICLHEKANVARLLFGGTLMVFAVILTEYISYRQLTKTKKILPNS